MRFKYSFIYWCAFMVLLSGCAKQVMVKPTFDTQKYRRIAILPFETDSFISTIGYQLADEMLVILIPKAPDMELIERARIDAVLQEQQMVRSGTISPESAITLGRLLGVSAIVTGSISVAVGDVQPTPLSPQRVANGTATLRFVDTETGKIIWAEREEAEYSTFKNYQNGNYASNLMTDHEMIQKVIRELGRKLAEGFYPHLELQY